MSDVAMRERLERTGQEQVLRFWDELDEAGRKRLTAQPEAPDPEHNSELSESHARNKPHVETPRDMRPVDISPRVGDDARRDLYARAAERGAQLLRDGKIGAFLVAG